MEFKCPECSYDLTPQFTFNKVKQIWKSNKTILTCGDCNSKIKVIKNADESVSSLFLIPEVRKQLRLGTPVERVVIGQESKEELYTRLFDTIDGVERCYHCEGILNTFTRLLVKIQTDIFPKKVEEVATFSPAGNPVTEIRTKYLPPIKEKAKLCPSCYKVLSLRYAIEILPEPRNMVRDGVRPNVVPVFGPAKEPDFKTPKETTEYELSKISGVWDEPLILGYNFSRRKDEERRMGTTNDYSGPERRKVERRKKLLLEITVRSKPSHRVRDFREDRNHPEVQGFHRANIERRREFIRKVITNG